MIELGPWKDQSAEKHLPVASVALSSYTDHIAMDVGN